MPFVNPSTVQNAAAGLAVSSSRQDAIDTALAFLATNAPHCKATRSSNLSVATGTVTDLTLPTEDWDVGGWHNTGANTEQLVVPTSEPAIYVLHAYATFATNNTGRRDLTLLKNGTAIAFASDASPSVSVPNVLQIGGEWSLAAGDVLKMQVEQTSGGNLNVSASWLIASWRWTA